MKKKLMAILTVMALCLSLAACGNNSTPASGQETAVRNTAQSTEATESLENDDSSQAQENSAQVQEEEKNKVAKDGAEMQTEDKSIATRIPMEGGTKINMYFGDTLITGVLNDSETAKALIEKLPMTQHMSRYSHDFCGVTEELPYNEDDVHCVNSATGDNYLTAACQCTNGRESTRAPGIHSAACDGDSAVGVIFRCRAKTRSIVGG